MEGKLSAIQPSMITKWLWTPLPAKLSPENLI